MKEQVLDKMKEKFTYGSQDSLPFRYVGLNVDKVDDKIIIDQDHFVQTLEIPDLKEISSLKKHTILPDKHQTEFRSLVSKLNMLSVTSRPDITFEVKILTTKYGKATKGDMNDATKLVKKVKRNSTKITIPDMGNVEDWILLAYADAATKKIDNAFSVAGHIVFLFNKKTNKNGVLWSQARMRIEMRLRCYLLIWLLVICN